jgi:hypothetical protein
LRREAKYKLHILLCLFLFSCSLSAQLNTDSLFKKGNPVFVFTKDKKELYGIVSSTADSSVVIKKGSKDSIVLLFSSISKAFIADENNMLRGKYIAPDKFYMLNPTFATAFPLPHKKVFLQTNFFYYGGIHYGLTKKVSASYFTSLLGTPVAVNLRFSIKLSEHLHIAPEAGIFSGSWFAPKLYMITTGARASQGGSLKNFTVGGGYALLRGMDEYIKLAKPKYEVAFITAGLKQRILRKYSVAADFWYFHKPRMIQATALIYRHNKGGNQLGLGCMFVSFKLPARDVNIPSPVVQMNINL